MDNIKIIPKMFLMIPSGTYNVQHLRPLKTNVTDHLIQKLYEKTRGGEQLQPSAIAGVSNSILSPSVKPVEEAKIPNGWEEKRYRFVMILDVTVNSGEKYTQVATGYTDYLGGIAGKKYLNPEMKLFFNSFQIFTVKTMITPNGVKNILTPYDSSQLIMVDKVGNSNPMNQFMYEHMNYALEKQLIRPQDIFHRLTMNMIANGIDDMDDSNSLLPNKNDNNNFDTGDVMDARTLANKNLNTSKRSNGNSSTYISSLLNGLKESKEAYSDTNTCNIYAEASHNKKIADKPISDNYTLYKINTMYDFTKRGHILLKELNAVIPELPYVTKVFEMSTVKKVRMPHEANSTNQLGGISKENHAAVILANALPDLMVDSLLGQINFIASNNYPDGLIKFSWTDETSAKSLAEGIEPFVNKFTHRLTNEILFDLTNQGATRMDLHVFADLTDDIRISIGFDGAMPEPYVLPLFCDSLFSPVITSNGEELSTFAKSMEGLCLNICGEV